MTHIEDDKTSALSRRDLGLTGAVALAAPAILAAAPALAQTPAPAPAATPQAPGFYRYKIGDMTLTAINDGFFTRPLEGFIRNAELPAVQAAQRAAFQPIDRVVVPFTTIVVQTGGRTVLLDTGNGNSGAPTSGTWMANFRAAGLDPAQVNTIAISHFHGDHINGQRLRDGTLTFPNAEIHVPEPEWAFWMSDERMAQAPEAMRGGFQNSRRVFAPIAERVKRYQPGAEIAPGIMSVAAHGHTPGHCVFALQSGAAKFMFLADTANRPELFVRQPDWAAVFDMDADAARASRRRLLDMAAEERMQVHFYHAPFPATGFIAKDGAGFQYVPIAWSSQV